jgi:hypothetical protein
MIEPPVPDPLPDGTRLADLQAAMQAAWIAGEKHVAAELSKRYGLYNTLCLRCGVPSLSVTALFTGPTDCWPDSFFARLCAPCQHEETPSIGQATIIDGTWNTRIDRPFDVKPLLAQLKAALAKLPPVEFVVTKAPRK